MRKLLLPVLLFSLISANVFAGEGKESVSSLPAGPQEQEDRNAFIGDFVYPNDFYRAYIYDRQPSLQKPGKVSYEIVIGSDGWFFLGNDLDKTYRRELMTKKELQYSVSFFKEIKEKCDEVGAKLLYFIPPVTSTIYPEYLPKTVKRRDRLVVDQVIAAVKAEAGVDIIYPKEALLKEKESYQLYTRSDAHWNEIGALIGANELFKAASRWFPDMEIHSPAEYKITRQRVFGDVGARQLNLEQIVADEEVTLVPTFHPAEDRHLPTTLVFHDSYYEAMKKIISENFNVVFSVPTTGGLNEMKNPREAVLRQIESTKPEVVIIELCERARIAYGF